MMLFHGTTREFTRFDLSHAGKRDSGNLGVGVYLSRTPRMAMDYAEDNVRRWGGTPTVLKVRASLGRVAKLDAATRGRLTNEAGVIFPPVAQDTRRSIAMRDWFVAQGYDAADNGDEVVVFDAEKLRILGPVSVLTSEERGVAISAALRAGDVTKAKRLAAGMIEATEAMNDPVTLPQPKGAWLYHCTYYGRLSGIVMTGGLAPRPGSGGVSFGAQYAAWSRDKVFVARRRRALFWYSRLGAWAEYQGPELPALPGTSPEDEDEEADNFRDPEEARDEWFDAHRDWTVVVLRYRDHGKHLWSPSYREDHENSDDYYWIDQKQKVPTKYLSVLDPGTGQWYLPPLNARVIEGLGQDIDGILATTLKRSPDGFGVDYAPNDTKVSGALDESYVESAPARPVGVLLVAEVLDRPRPWRWDSRTPGEWVASFEAPAGTYQVRMERESVEFELFAPGQEVIPGGGDMSLSGGGNAGAVLATVIDIVGSWVRSTKPARFHFFAATASRRKLYARLAVRFERMGYSWKLDDTMFQFTRTKRITESRNERAVVLGDAKFRALLPDARAALEEDRRVVLTRTAKGGTRWDWAGEEPFKESDRITVYHGFRYWGSALISARFGLSGKEMVSRNYSFEMDNNPKGLFVSLDFQTTKQFAAAHASKTSPSVIVEFDAKYSELEAPVWPGGGYAIQGDKALTFGQGARGRPTYGRHQATLAARADAATSKEPAIAKSDRPEIAQTLLGGEFQALYVGDLDPARIRALWIREESGQPYRRLKRAEFLKRYSSAELTRQMMDQLPTKGYAPERVFKPSDEWNADKLVAALAKMHATDAAGVRKSLGYVATSLRPIVQTGMQYVWPKQLPGFVQWAKKLPPSGKRPTTGRRRDEGVDGPACGMPIYGGLPSSGNFGAATEYEIGAQRAAEATHCLLGSIERAGRMSIRVEAGHIKEEMGIIEFVSKEYGKSLYSKRLVDGHYSEEHASKTVESIRKTAPKLKAQAKKFIPQAERWFPDDPARTKAIRWCYYYLIALCDALVESVADYPKRMGNAYSDTAVRSAALTLRGAVDDLLREEPFKESDRITVYHGFR